MTAVLDVTPEIAELAPKGAKVLVSGGVLSLVDFLPGMTRLVVLRGIVGQVLGAWRRVPGAAHDTPITLPKGSRFVVTAVTANGADTFVIRTYAEACLAESFELDPEGVEVFERHRAAEWLQ